MALVTLFCDETRGLKLGPGSANNAGGSRAPDLLVFKDGFVTFEADEFPGWEEWAFHSGSPFIRITEAGEGPGGVECPVCHKEFKSEFALKGHLNVHNPNRKAK